MKKIALLLVLLPTLASAQFTQAQINGLVKSLQDSIQMVNQGTPPVIVNGTRVTFGGTVTAGTPCIRCTVRLTDAQATFLTVPLSYFTEPANRYAVMQVCGAADATYRAVPDWLQELIETCSKTPISASAGWSQVTVAARTDPVAQAAATGFACACSTGASCNWTPPLPGGGFGASTAAPKGMTIPAGLWSGAGCRLKTCVESFGTESMPLECK